MPRPHRLLLPAAAPPPEAAAAESDLAVVLAALLCALICVLGLMAVARCTWLRRGPDAGDSPAANKGVKKRVLRSIPKVSYSSGDGEVAGDSPECAICLGEFVDGEEVRLLPRCGHAFHVACIDTWLGSHSSCPSCRRVLTAFHGGDGGEAAADPKVGRCLSNDFLP